MSLDLNVAELEKLKAEVETALATAQKLLVDVTPLEAFMPSSVKTAVADVEKVLTFVQAVLAKL